MLIGLAVTILPLVKLARRESQLAQEPFRRQLGPLRPVLEVVDDFVAYVRASISKELASFQLEFPIGFFCLDVLLHEFRDDLVLHGEFGLKLLDLAVLGLFDATVASRPLESLVGLVENPFDPVMDLAGLDSQFIGQVADSLLAAQVPPHHLCLLVGAKVPTCFRHKMILPRALC